MQPLQPLKVECPGCSCCIELSAQESGLLVGQEVQCPECGQSVPLPPADGGPHVDAGPDEAPSVHQPASYRGVSETPTAGRQQQKSSPAGIIVAALLGGVTIIGAYMLFPGFFPGVAGLLLSAFRTEAEVNDPDENAAGQPAQSGLGTDDEDSRRHRADDDPGPREFHRPQTADKKTDVDMQPAAKPPPIPKPKPPSPKELAKQADNKLRLAKILLKRGKKSEAKQRFQKIVEEYPDTKAAEEAGKLLDGL